jgi:CheY-like chemotaxis protein
VQISEDPNIEMRPGKNMAEKSILVIDDSTDMLEIQRTLLEMDGFNVLTARSGDEALKLLDQVDKLELILLDVQMEGMSGPDFLKRLDETKPNIVTTVPVIFLTAREEIPAGNVLGFIRKPFEMDTFLEAVHHYIDLGRNSPRYH